MSGPVKQTWWEIECVSEEGWYVIEYTRLGTLAARETARYGPMTHYEIFDVLDVLVACAIERGLAEVRQC